MLWNVSLIFVSFDFTNLFSLEDYWVSWRKLLFCLRVKIINQDFTEWALIDGASSFSSFWNIGLTTPFLRLEFKSWSVFPSVFSLASSSLDSSLEVSFSSWKLGKKILVRDNFSKHFLHIFFRYYEVRNQDFKKNFSVKKPPQNVENFIFLLTRWFFIPGSRSVKSEKFPNLPCQKHRQRRDWGLISLWSVPTECRQRK